ncbi:hydroxymethylglutaryl-CoA reductase [Diaporthe sp. PMI_573]|nr:hydroxymethylglutaryl-CoA reductase [Diaporthaceae sp. PMI_573]
MAEKSTRERKVHSYYNKKDIVSILRDPESLQQYTIENVVGVTEVPVGMAGPLRLSGPDNIDTLFMDTLAAPLATYEPTLVASCSRGCKAFNASGGLNFEILGDGMSRAPVFVFDHPGHAVAFARAVPSFRAKFAEWAESTSRFVQFRSMNPTVIGSQVHLLCTYHCGSAAGQNMVTKATQHACDMLREELEIKFFIRDFLIEGQLASDKKPSWGNVKVSRGVEVIVWGTITNQTCQSVLGCSTDRLYFTHQTVKEGGIRNGQFGSNINTANILAALFISTGQDVGSVAEASWSHLTSELDNETKDLRLSLYFPSLPVGTVGGGTGYPTQREALKLLKCDGPDMKGRLAGIIASFALALDLSTGAAVANDTFTQSHMRLARGEKL